VAPGRWREPQSPGLSRQSAYAKARDCQGGGLFPLGPPPFAEGEQISIVREAEPTKPEPAQPGTGQVGTGQVGTGPSRSAELHGGQAGAGARNPSGATGASRIEIRDLSVVQNTTLTYTQHSTASLIRQR